MQLPDDAIRELWALYDVSGIRPEYVLPVLYVESAGFNPAIANQAGAPYYGIGQDSAAAIERAGYTVPGYLAASAADQIRSVVAPRLASLVHQAGPLRSATRVYQANFLPGTSTVNYTNDGQPHFHLAIVSTDTQGCAKVDIVGFPTHVIVDANGYFG